MPNEPREMPDDLLEKAIAARRDMETPLGPPPPVLAATIERLKAADESKTFSLNWSLSTMLNIRKLGIAAMLAIAIAGVFFALSRNSGVAFADVIKNVTAAKCVSFKGSGTIDIPGRPPMPLSMRNWITESGRMRQEMAPSGTVMIMDQRQGKWLTLDAVNRRATIMEMANQPAQTQVNLFEQFKVLDAKSGTPIGAKEIAGHKTQGFRVVTPALDMSVWADTETRLPVQIEQTLKLAFMPSTMVTLSDFVWNAQVDESLMSLTPPEGYTVQTMTMNMAPTTEKDLIEALKIAAELNDGRFPDSFDITGVSTALGKSMGKAMAKGMATLKIGSAEQKELEKKSGAAMAVVSRGWLFLGDPKNGEDWHYAGKNVELGKAGIPMMWYRPQGASGYRVIDADLTVREVQADAVPNVPSSRMGPSATTAPSAVVQ